ncbi:SxtJ family membrane protein [Gammaproteobacteria bacterium]|nr:SxtJ family membrane protein [Gammaproteobacteria bacterium]
MHVSQLQLPRDKKFGYFFSLIFIALSSYFFLKNSNLLSYIFISLAIIFLIFAIFKSEVLHPLNILWMRFGLLIGKIVSPLVLGFIFFGIFTPISIFMRIIGRDELRLKVIRRNSFWKKRGDNETRLKTFFDQF